MDDPSVRLTELESKIRALEKELAASRETSRIENTYRAFFEASAEAMLTLCDGYFIECNESAVRMLRAGSKEEVLKTHPWELSPAYQPDGQLSSEKAQKMIVLAEQEGSLCFEWDHQRMDGDVFPVEVTLTAITIGNKKMFNSSWREIGDRKAAEKELHEYQGHLEEMVAEKTEALSRELKKHEMLENDIRQILDASGDAIRVIDCDFNIIYANRPLENLKEIPLQELRGQKCYDAVPEKECFSEDCSLKRILRTGQKFTKEVIMDPGNGRETPYLVTVAPYINADGKLIGAIKTYRDITEEKRASKAAEETALQQGRVEMANNMLHDIGNAMTGISAYVLKPQVEKTWPEINSLHQLHGLLTSNEEELRRVFGKEKQAALDQFITALTTSFEERNTHHLDTFKKIAAAVGHVCSVLDLQRHYMREKSVLLTTEVNLKTLIGDTLVMLAGSLEKRKIQVTLTSSTEYPVISGDQTRLIRVFLNIIKNCYEAFDLTDPETDRKLDIRMGRDEEEKLLRVTFVDNAIGFAPETGKNLFTRGFTTKSNGSGIGLHECRAVIESHNGTMTMESDGKNTGARIMITFPLPHNQKE